MNLNRKPVITNTFEVGHRLHALGWTVSELNEVVDAAVSGRNSVTANDPPNAAGWMSWKEGSRRLREIGVMKGLERDDRDSVTGVRDDSRGIKFVMCNTDVATGMPHETPRNNSERGPATSRLLENNDENFGQLLRDSRNVVALRDYLNAPNAIGGITIWYLCVYAEADVVRAELSCPTGCSGGFFNGFSQRIIFKGFDEFGDGFDRKEGGDDDEGDGFNIEVFRRTL